MEEKSMDLFQKYFYTFKKQNWLYYRSKDNIWNERYLIPPDKKELAGIRLDLDECNESTQNKLLKEKKQKKFQWRKYFANIVQEQELRHNSRQKQFRDVQMVHFRENQFLNGLTDVWNNNSIDQYSRGVGGMKKPDIPNKFRETYVVKDSIHYQR